MSAKKIVLLVVVLLVLGGIVVGTILHGQASVTKVATGKVVRQDLVSVVSGTGQIKPKTYVNIGATAFGRITHLNVKEGDHVKAGAILATVESVQPAATVAAQQATIASSRTDVNSFVAAEKTAEANIAQAKADLEQKKPRLRPRPGSLQRQAHRQAGLRRQEGRLRHGLRHPRPAAGGRRPRPRPRPPRSAPTSTRPSPASAPTSTPSTRPSAAPPSTASSPTSPSARARPWSLGIQNAQGSTLMTLADMSVITAEVKVDETDIVNVALEPDRRSSPSMPCPAASSRATSPRSAIRPCSAPPASPPPRPPPAPKRPRTSRSSSPSIEVIRRRFAPASPPPPRSPPRTSPNALTIPIQALVQRDPAAEEGSRSRTAGTNPPQRPHATPPARRPSPSSSRASTSLADDHRKAARPLRPRHHRRHRRHRYRGPQRPVRRATRSSPDRYKILRTLKSGTVVKGDNTAEAPAPTS